MMTDVFPAMCSFNTGQCICTHAWTDHDETGCPICVKKAARPLLEPHITPRQCCALHQEHDTYA